MGTMERKGIAFTSAMAVLALCAPAYAQGGAVNTDAAIAADVAACDAVAAHPDDPDKVGPGHVKAEIDLPVTIDICRKAAKADPDNLRIRYQLARMLFYSGERNESLKLMKSTAEGGYRQAQFVYGVFINYQRDGAPKNLCLTESFWKKSAVAGRQAARVNYVRERLNDRFVGCPDMATTEEMHAMLKAALADSGNYYETLFIKDLSARLERRSGKAEDKSRKQKDIAW